MKPMMQIGCTLSALVAHADRLAQVRKADVHEGDVVLIKTKNSLYTIRAIQDGMYTVSGGWFDRKGLSEMKVGIRGCTWGGSAIKIDVVAACGLCLEFSNRVVTSPIESIAVLPRGRCN